MLSKITTTDLFFCKVVLAEYLAQTLAMFRTSRSFTNVRRHPLVRLLHAPFEDEKRYTFFANKFLRIITSIPLQMGIAASGFVISNYSTLLVRNCCRNLGIKILCIQLLAIPKKLRP